MGRAARWLRGLLGGGGKKSPDSDDPPESRSTRGKKKWGFVKSSREKEGSPRHGADAPGASYREVHGPPRSYALAGAAMDEEQNKRAIAVAAATAAVAEAAVAAAQAAAAVVRLTSSGRGTGRFGDGAVALSSGYGKREKWAAVRIQSAFRGYLARRALKALKGLVKLQALVRGNIVRKQAAETLRCMQALVRVQARARASRALHSENSGSEKSLSTNAGPPTPEKFEQATRAGFIKPDVSSNIRRTSMKPSAVNIVDHDRANPAGWNWLDRWMEERYWDSRELTKRTATSTDDERSAKILEVDPGKPQFNNKRRNNHHYSSCSTLTSDQNSRSFATVLDSPSKDSTIAQQSVPSPSSVDMHHSLNTLRFPVEVGDYVESPHVYSASSRHGSSRRGPFTPSKSECSRSFFSGYSDYPNYMANTESSRAKLRSQSAPKQRPDYEKLSSSVKRLPTHDYGQNSSGASSQKSSSMHAKFTNKAYPGSGRLDRLGMPIRY